MSYKYWGDDDKRDDGWDRRDRWDEDRGDDCWGHWGWDDNGDD